jgi:ergothioneine biosynthesis protein EgtB
MTTGSAAPALRRRARTTALPLDSLARARQATDELFGLLDPEALLARPIPARHRLIFYLGHLEAFDWNQLAPVLSLAPAKPLSAGFAKLFAAGIDPLDGGLPDEPAAFWPPAHRVRAYGMAVRAVLDEALAGADPDRAWENLHVAIEHRWMHAETLAYLLHELPIDAKRAPAAPGLGAAPAHNGARIAPRMLRIPPGVATLGRARGAGFGWDNEFAATRVMVPEFAISSTMVTNAEFLAFVRDGGYADRRLWSEADWEWRERAGVRHPHFWIARDGDDADYAYRGMFAVEPLTGDWPVYVSHAEALAYARWAGKSLPTEAQFHRAAYGAPDGGERIYPWGEADPTPGHGNFGGARWDPTPVGAFPRGASAFGLADALGNGWDWTVTPFGPLPGFVAFPFYPGYSADFFDGRHFVLKGGSARTALPLLRRSFRNWFQPHYPYPYAGFRLVTP